MQVQVWYKIFIMSVYLSCRLILLNGRTFSTTIRYLRGRSTTNDLQSTMTKRLLKSVGTYGIEDASELDNSLVDIANSKDRLDTFPLTLSLSRHCLRLELL